MKSQLAKARDKWLQSRDGNQCTFGEARGQYLHNRIERAFIAGWDACKCKEGRSSPPESTNARSLDDCDRVRRF